jgi:hypothetical protein
MECAMLDRNSPKPAYPALDMVLNSIADWVNNHRFARRDRSGLSRCDRNEVMRIARDVGVSLDELHLLARKGPRAADLNTRMLVALGVDPKALSDNEPLVMRDLQRLCGGCVNKGRCAHELAEGTAAAHFHAFCPNAYTLDALMAEKGKRAVH